ncbi:Beta-glucosidase BoGH3B [Pontiella desulfatans]|uniref:Beta-glucosidase BoGH3B n=1 Tax=Pontiella desulfatans TaxID=2750659 RepID=A0A6C2TY00_PONDE|nr:glycoside hydrolase family 3 N-terminal domain-containing protein [Pontiella desulfatans]VGO12525.1 Beta-glucosidase BoGH3B [Pontiella desulfatans]
MMKNKWMGMVLATAVVVPCFAEPDAPYKDASLPVEQRVEDLLGRMTLEEKVAQMRIFHANKGIKSGKQGELVMSKDVVARLEYGIAGIKNPGEPDSPEQAAKLTNELQEYIIGKSRLDIPAMFVCEAYNGVDAHGSTRFMRPMNMAATWNVDLVNRIWTVTGREARLRGFHMCHSPESDIMRDPRFGRMSEAFSEDSWLTTEMVVAAVKGVQGGYDGTGVNSTHIGAVAKHFAGYGQVQGGRNFASIQISERDLIDQVFPPFKGAVQRAHAFGIMASHGDLNGVASHANPWLLTEVLRKQWGFKGYVVSDSNDIARLHDFMKVAESHEAAVEMALKAGMDVDLYSDLAYVHLTKMAKADPSLIPFIDRSVSNVLRTKFKLGLFENPYTSVGDTKMEVRSEASLALAREADLESAILLENKKNTLPLDAAKIKKVALLGPLLYTDTQDMFEQVTGDAVEYVSAKGFALTDGKRGRPALMPRDEKKIASLVEKAKAADVAVLFLGGDEYTSKEAFFSGAYGDRDLIDPVGPQDELVQRVKALGKPVVVVLKHRRTLSINVISDQADAILDCWDLSELGDLAVAEILFGKVSPSGKLPVTVPRSIGQFPFEYSQKEINYKKGYLFQKDGPLYPFGHGLSYGRFTYSKPKLSGKEMAKDGTLTVSVDVSNAGKIEAKEVVQLYVKDLIGSVTRPDKELKGFEKIELKPGETKAVAFTITPDMLMFTGLEMKPVLEAGDYEVMVGTSSADVQKAAFRLK